MLSKLKRSNVMGMCDERIFCRGEDYYKRGFVRELIEVDGIIHAKVIGTYIYDVEIKEKDGIMEADCSCPFEGFCKHIAAVLLAWVNRDSSKSKVEFIDTKHVKEYLQGVDKDKLVEIIMGYASTNMNLLKSLKVDASIALRKSIDVNSYKREIANAMDVDFIDYYSQIDFIKNLNRIEKDIRKLIDPYPNDACDLLFYFIEKCMKKIDYVDDSSGSFGDFIVELGSLYGKSLRNADIDENIIAPRLIKLYFKFSDYGVEDAILEAMKELNNDSLAKIEDLAWGKLKKAGKKDEWEIENAQDLILEIVERRDNERYIELCKEWKRYRRLVDKLKELNRYGEAIHAAKEGIDNGIKLREELYELYKNQGDYESALSIGWKIFFDSTRNGFIKIKEASALLGRWDEERGKIIEFLEDNKRNEDLLVGIYLETKDLEKALEHSKGIGEYTLKKLAESVERRFPEKAIEIYSQIAEKSIDMRSNDAYRRAAGYLKKAKAVYKRMDRMDNWVKYIEDIRTIHKRKINFMAEIKGL
ncbi:MAG: SWIM zinc finger family protein [Candidatus Thermoplasmatota archaeon]|nr:SWIM zinc finger family protein [Candidatus Thermoplasmatota archaeon]